MAEMKKARQDHACVQVSSLVIVAGGYYKGEPTETVEIYFILQNRWEQRNPLPGPDAGGKIVTVTNFGPILYMGKLLKTICKTEINQMLTDKQEWTEVVAIEKTFRNDIYLQIIDNFCN